MHQVGSDEEGSESPGPSVGGVKLGKGWEAVGPFPTGTREHPLIHSPLHAYPSGPHADPDVHYALRAYDPAEVFPSELGNDGRAGWTTFETGEDGWTELSYPNIDWQQLRGDHGWASLQYQTLLRTTLSIPQSRDRQARTAILIDLIQGVEFALIPTSREPTLPVRWYAGDVYDFSSSLAGQQSTGGRQTSNFARRLSVEPGEYVMLVRAMYEIRMFGDPGRGTAPVIRMKVAVEVDDHRGEAGVEVLGGTALVMDFVDGLAMGEWVSVGMRAGGRGVTVTGVELEGQVEGLEVEMPWEYRIASGQTRPIALRLRQTGPISSSLKLLPLIFRANVDGRSVTSRWNLPIKHRSRGDLRAFKITFPSPSLPSSGPPAQISYAMVKPPLSLPVATTHCPPVILALHGAGVDVSNEVWADALPHRPAGWAVLPMGKTEWGEDWHGGSMEDAWAARAAVAGVAERLGCGAVSDQTLVVGHSNGGQGAWHLASHYPDRVVGVIAIAGWLNIQHYVPYTEYSSSHYADPALMGILASALTPYANDLHLSNLSHIPYLCVHGSADDNVAPRHGRAYASLLSSWNHHPDSRFVEVPGKGHWWDECFRHPAVLDFVRRCDAGEVGKRSWDKERKVGFTLSCADPQECGGRAGLRVLELEIPGRMGRLDVNVWKGDGEKGLDLRGTNVKRVEVIGGVGVEGDDKKVLVKWRNGFFPQDVEPPDPPRAYGPMIRLLATTAPLILVPSEAEHAQSIAARIAHDLFVYHRTDAEIISPREALERVAREDLRGNVVVIGRPEENELARWMVRSKRIPVTFPTEEMFMVDDKLVYDKGAGVITLHPHPTSSTALACLIAGNDSSGLELAARFFPIRTGVPVPDWAVVSPRMAWQGAGGLIGAGFWGADWKWSEAMSWFDR